MRLFTMDYFLYIMGFIMMAVLVNGWASTVESSIRNLRNGA